MTKQPKRPRDPNQLAKLIVDIATGEDQTEPAIHEVDRGKVKGGEGRAAKLEPSRRTEIAREAAKKRWARD